MRSLTLVPSGSVWLPGLVTLTGSAAATAAARARALATASADPESAKHNAPVRMRARLVLRDMRISIPRLHVTQLNRSVRKRWLGHISYRRGDLRLSLHRSSLVRSRIYRTVS